MDASIKLPGGFWKPSRSITQDELDRAMNVLIAARESGWAMVTFEGVSYHWVAENVAPKLQREHAAIEAGTHEPAVDDFGNQYLARKP